MEPSSLDNYPGNLVLNNTNQMKCCVNSGRRHASTFARTFNNPYEIHAQGNGSVGHASETQPKGESRETIRLVK